MDDYIKQFGNRVKLSKLSRNDVPVINNNKMELGRKTREQFLRTQFMKSFILWYNLPFFKKFGEGKYWSFPNWASQWPPRNPF